MIQYIEIINFGDQIRIVTKDEGSSEFNEPIEFNLSIEVNTFEEIIATIKNHLDNGSIHMGGING